MTTVDYLDYDMKKYIIFILIVGISNFLSYAYFSKKIFLLEQLVILNEHSSYQQFSNISHEINSGRIDSAKCIADLVSSSFYKNIIECNKSRECSNSVWSEVVKNSPEIMDKSKIQFKYYKNNESCGR